MDFSVQIDKEHEQVYLALSRRAIEHGVVARSQRLDENITLDFDEFGTLLGIDIINAAAAVGPDFDSVKFDALVGVKEAAELLGVLRPNFVRDYASKPDFPQPVVELATGRVWLKSQVQAYQRTRREGRTTKRLSRDLGNFATALALLREDDELVLRQGAMVYIRDRLLHGASSPPSVEQIVADSIEADREAVRHVQDGYIDDFVDAASQLYTKYSKALESYIGGRVESAAAAKDILRGTWVRGLRDIQQGAYDFQSVSFTRWLLGVAHREMTNRGVEIEPINAQSDDPLGAVINAMRYEQALSEHEQRKHRLESEAYVVQYLVNLSARELDALTTGRPLKLREDLEKRALSIVEELASQSAGA